MAFFNLMLSLLIVIGYGVETPELMTKQSLHNIRLTTRDGKFTYYQRGSQSLLLSSNYSVKEIIKSEQGSHFDVIGSTHRKRILILLDKTFHTMHSISQPRIIYWSTFGGDTAIKLTEGNSANLHLNDSWASVYSVIEKKIKFFNLSNSDLDFSIKLANRFNPFFIPQIQMVSENQVLYTDVNKDGLSGLLSYDRKTRKNKLIYKVDEPYFKIEFCIQKDKLLLGHFSLDRSNKYSQILSSSINKVDFNELYLSDGLDIGNMHCPNDEDLVYFIKDTSAKNQRYTSDVFSLDIKSKKLKQISKLNTITQIIDMDGMLLAPSKGKYYVLKGNSNLNTLDTLRGQ